MNSDLLQDLNEAASAECKRLDAAFSSLDIHFVSFLRKTSQFGFFTYGPIHIDVRLLEDIVERTTPRRTGAGNPPPPYGDDFVRFSSVLMNEVRRSGRQRIDELHYLLAFMRCGEGLPARVFGELGVTPEQVEVYARNRIAESQPLEKLYSPEEAAEYLNVHVQTVRAWIRSGRLRARRLAGQRALRITASDLLSVLDPVNPEDPD